LVSGAIRAFGFGLTKLGSPVLALRAKPVMTAALRHFTWSA
jgi:hypothetical protein